MAAFCSATLKKTKTISSRTKEKSSLYLSRFRPTQTKTKKTKTETKLEFFGFEDKEDQEGEEGPESGKAGKSSYKIKYFGFDDLSESDSDDESSRAKEKKAKKAAAALAALSSSVDSPHTSDSQDSQASSNTGELIPNDNTTWSSGPVSVLYHPFIWLTIWFSPTDAFDFSDDCSPGSTDGQKGRSGKPSDKSKDIGSGLKKIFSGPKKVNKHARNCLCVCLCLSLKSQFVILICVRNSPPDQHWSQVSLLGLGQTFIWILLMFKWRLHNRISIL